MTRSDLSAVPHRDAQQQARLMLRFGKRVRMEADVSVTPAGLLAIGALVSGVLLSTAVIVRTARR